MKRTLIAIVAVVGFAAAANASSITITADQASYNVSDTITLTIQGTVSTAGNQAFVQVGYDNSLVGTPNQTVTPALITTFNGGSSWTVGVTQGTCTASTCTAIDMLGGIALQNIDQANLTAEITFHADAAGTATFATTSVFFFGAGPASTSVTIVPEPTTAGLLAIGLFGLAVAGRRR